MNNKKPNFKLISAIDRQSEGVMIYRDEDLKCTMTIVTPRGRRGQAPKRTFEIDGDKRKFTDPNVFLKILDQKT